jgi:hypothetical protein
MTDGLALFLGAAIIAFFSYDRFDRVTHQGGRQLERVVSLLSPNKMRARHVVLRAYVFYALALIIIYLFMCAYAELLPYVGGPGLDGEAVGAQGIPIAGVDATSLQTTGFNSSDIPRDQQLSDVADPKGQETSLGVDPTVSLTVALIIVGLAPSFPALQRVENWIRLAAHRLAGIPTWVIGASEDLSRNALGILPADGNTVPADPLLIPQGYWERILQYQIGAKGKLTGPDEFRHDLEIIFASASWILDRKLRLSNSSGRQDFDALEASLRKRIASLIQNLDEKSGFRPGYVTPIAAANDAEGAVGSSLAKKDDDVPVELLRESWDRLADDAADLANDLHILLALYVEHEIITNEEVNSSAKAGQKDIARQRVLARKKLQDFLGSILAERTDTGRLPLSTMTVWLWATTVIVAVTLLWTIMPGNFETELQFGLRHDIYWRAPSYFFGALNQYSVPIIVALMIRDSVLESKRWKNVWTSHWTAVLPQAIFVIGLSWTVAALSMIGLGLWQSGLTISFADNAKDMWNSLAFVFEANTPSALRGSILAWIIICLLDRPSSEKLEDGAPKKDNRVALSFRWAIASAVIMALCGTLTRLIMSLAALARSGRPGLDSIDYGLIFYATVLAAIIGFTVIFCLSEAIRSARFGNATPLPMHRRAKAAPIVGE